MKNPPTVWLSITTGPMLIALMVAQSFGEGLQELGKASEEVFRGDRLPLLNFPVEGEAKDD